MDKKIVLLLIIFFFLAGCALGVVLEKKIQNTQLSLSDLSKDQEEENNKEEIDYNKFQDENSSHILLEEIYEIDGTVVQLGNDFLIVELIEAIEEDESFDLSGKIPLEENKPEKQNLKINVSEETKILKIQQSDLNVPEVSQESSEELLINFNDIKEGNHVFIIVDEKIKDQDSFVAKEIKVVEADIIIPEE
ncbi:MAG: hypothetical protein PHT66_01310 [Candidatus Pacebacteria bacterium]|nr:hypothetical protein [Candidatus Paceibacterota bacterium]